MNLIWHNEHDLDYEDFLLALRRSPVERFIKPSDERFNELQMLQADLFRIDAQLRQLCEMNPNKAKCYETQHAEAREVIAKQLANLAIPGVRIVK